MRARIYTYTAEIRPANCLMAASAALIGILVSKTTLSFGLIGPGVLTFVVIFLVTAGGNVINDYFDITIDKVNKPDRALPSGQITQRGALLYAITLTLFGVAVALSVSYTHLTLPTIYSV